MFESIIVNKYDFFALIVPGYIYLNIRKKIYDQKKDSEQNIILKSVIISMISQIIGNTLMYCFTKLTFLKFINQSNIVQNLSNEIKILIYVFIPLFYLLCLLIKEAIKTKIKEKIKFGEALKLSFSNYVYKEESPNIFYSLLRDTHNKVLKISLKESNYIYYGYLHKYTIDPDEVEKELSLQKYWRMFEICTNNEYELVDIDDYYDSDNSYIYFKMSEIKSIEILDETMFE